MYMPETVQCTIFSAMMPLEVLEVTEKFMCDSIRILFEVLCDLYSTLTITLAIIYCNIRRSKVDWLMSMQAKDFTVSSMHGDLDQKERDTIFVYISAHEDYSAETATTAAFKHICDYGLMIDGIISDPGSAFTSKLMEQLMKWLSVKHMVSVVDVHTSNGVEPANREILRHLKANL
eukprot:gene18520-18800_t